MESGPVQSSHGVSDEQEARRVYGVLLDSKRPELGTARLIPHACGACRSCWLVIEGERAGSCVHNGPYPRPPRRFWPS